MRVTRAPEGRRYDPPPIVVHCPPIGIACRHAGLVRMEVRLTEKPLNAAACQQDVQRRRMVGKASQGNFVVSNLSFHRGPLSNDRSMVSAGANALIKSRCRGSEGLGFLCQAKLLARRPCFSRPDFFHLWPPCRTLCARLMKSSYFFPRRVRAKPTAGFPGTCADSAPPPPDYAD
jgi:hypothetical protein